jgi:hypothetical protein
MLCGNGCLASANHADESLFGSDPYQAISSAFEQILALVNDRISDIIFAIDRSG